MTTTHDELEARLASLFREQAEATPVPAADWTELRPVSAVPNRPNGRLAFAAAAVVAAVVVAVVTTGGDTERVRTGPADDTGRAARTTTAVPAAFSVETRHVSLSADAVAIDAGGLRFATAEPIQVHSDPGVPKEYTTLELTWQEHGVEMRLFVYFTSDGREWWSDEIRTYDGRADGDWITYRGEFFRRPLGTPFVGDFEVAEPGPGTGRLRLSNARLEAFRRLPSCDAAAAGLVLDPGASPVEIPGPLAAYGVNVHLLDAASCSVVPDQDRYRYEWASRDPGVVTVDTSFQPPELGTRHAQLRGERPGTTSVVVTAVDPDTGAAVADVEIPVEVGEASAPTVQTAAPATPAGAPPVTTVPAPPPAAGDQGPVLRSVTADLGAGTITVTFDQPVRLGPAPLAAMYLVVYGDDPGCTTPAGNSHEVLSGGGTATLTLDATSLARPVSYITLAPGFVLGTETGTPSAPLGCTPVPTA